MVIRIKQNSVRGIQAEGLGRLWTLRETAGNSEGKKTTTLEKKTGVTHNSDNKTTLPDKWSAWCRG